MLTDEERKKLETSLEKGKQAVDVVHNMELDPFLPISMIGTFGVVVMKLIAIVYLIFGLVGMIDPFYTYERKKIGFKKAIELYKYI